MTTSEKVAYLKGLAEGLGLDKDSKEDKLFSAIIDILGDVASDIEDLEIEVDELGDGLDAVSEDLELLEDDFYEEYESCDDDCCHDEDVFYEVTCPACNNTITVDEDVIALGKIQCPNCEETLEFTFDKDDCGCGCGDEAHETPESPAE